jgi:cell division protein FtsB
MSSIIGPVISLVISLIPIFTLVWNMSKLAAQVKENTKDTDHLGDKIRELSKEVQDIKAETNVTNVAIIERLTRIETKLDAFERKEK